MKYILLSIVLFFTRFEQNPESEMYSYRNRYFTESINLLNNNTFDYIYNTDFLKIKVNGYWIKNGDSLLLNSTPQHDKIIVREQQIEKKKNKNKLLFWVVNKDNLPIDYSITLYDENGESIEISNQREKTEFVINKFKVHSFEITDSKALKSPKYIIESKYANNFYIIFEQRRVFDGEVWAFCKEGLIPKLSNGKKADYLLVRSFE
jgi:hypothetical protein